LFHGEWAREQTEKGLPAIIVGSSPGMKEEHHPKVGGILVRIIDISIIDTSIVDISSGIPG